MRLLKGTIYYYIRNEEVKIVKRTPLYESHCQLGGKLIDFGGWELPVQYTGIIEEHEERKK